MQVPFSEVRERFLYDHPLKEGSNSPAFWNLEQADRQSAGKWIYRVLTMEELLNCVLSHHDHWKEKSDVQLIPIEGLTVIQAIDRYKALQNYNRTNPLCWRTIEFVKTAESDIYLSRAPLDTPDFQPLNRFDSGHWFVLDGLHRLIAWGLAQRYTKSNLEKTPINAFIAG